MPTYTLDTFLEDFPQLKTLPEGVVYQFIAMAQECLAAERWGEKWRFAMGLYVAHYATLYLQAYSQAADTPALAVRSGAATGLVTSEQAGDLTVDYDHAALLKGQEPWGMWNSTLYGRLLATEAKLAGLGGAFVI